MGSQLESEHLAKSDLSSAHIYYRAVGRRPGLDDCLAAQQRPIVGTYDDSHLCFWDWGCLERWGAQMMEGPPKMRLRCKALLWLWGRQGRDREIARRSNGGGGLLAKGVKEERATRDRVALYFILYKRSVSQGIESRVTLPQQRSKKRRASAASESETPTDMSSQGTSCPDVPRTCVPLPPLRWLVGVGYFNVYARE